MFNIITTFGNIFFKFKTYFQFFECLLYKNLSRHKKCKVVVIFPWNLPTNATLVSNKLLILSDNRCGFGANNSTFEDNVQINIMCAHLLGLAENSDCALNNEKLWTQLKENPGEVPRGTELSLVHIDRRCSTIHCLWATKKKMHKTFYASMTTDNGHRRCLRSMWTRL